MQSSKYLISFILPIYNAQATMCAALQSILAQPCEKEIILVNDGSTDESLAIALEYAAQYAFINVISSNNRGVSAARNIGLALARGEFVLFLDPDDVLEGQTDFGKACQLMNAQKAQVMKGQYISYEFDQPQHITAHPIAFDEVKGEQFVRCSFTHFLKQLFVHSWRIQIACFLIRRDFLINNQLAFNESLGLHEDSLFCLDLLCCSAGGQIIEVANYFMHYIGYPNSTIRQPIDEKRLQAHLLAIELVSAKARDCQDESVAYALWAATATFCYFLHHDVLNAPSNELRAMFEPKVTNEMIALYRRFGLPEMA